MQLLQALEEPRPAMILRRPLHCSYRRGGAAACAGLVGCMSHVLLLLCMQQLDVAGDCCRDVLVLLVHGTRLLQDSSSLPVALELDAETGWGWDGALQQPAK